MEKIQELALEMVKSPLEKVELPNGESISLAEVLNNHRKFFVDTEVDTFYDQKLQTHSTKSRYIIKQYLTPNQDRRQSARYHVVSENLPSSIAPKSWKVAEQRPKKMEQIENFLNAENYLKSILT